MIVELSATGMTWKQRIFKGECSSSPLKKYIKSPAALRAARIIKRLVWMGVVLGATIGCLITISDRIKYLNSHPTATTISIIENHPLTFPAVTVCNLNIFRREILKKRNLTDLIYNVTRLVRKRPIENCERDLQLRMALSQLDKVEFEELTVQARDSMEKLFKGCYFAGDSCGNLTKVFEPVFTNLGICYTFNSGKARRLVQSRGVGQREGLRLVIKVNQSGYSTPLDAGVKIAIHNQSEPPLPADRGIGVPTGRSAFISIKEKKIQDRARKHCRPKNNRFRLNFLKRKYTYSEPACLVDCVHTAIAEDCECIGARSFYPPDIARYSRLPNCTLEKVCCVLNALSSPNTCRCPAACTSLHFEAAVSYSYYPAEYISHMVAQSSNTTPSEYRTNFLEVNVFFESLNVETQTTDKAYTPVALLSDIGGQVGLFLGLSVISVLEFGDWIIKMIRGRDLTADIKKIKNKCCTCCHEKHSVALEDSGEDLIPVESETSCHQLD